MKKKLTATFTRRVELALHHSSSTSFSTCQQKRKTSFSFHVLGAPFSNVARLCLDSSAKRCLDDCACVTDAKKLSCGERGSKMTPMLSPFFVLDSMAEKRRTTAHNFRPQVTLPRKNEHSTCAWVCHIRRSNHCRSAHCALGFPSVPRLCCSELIRAKPFCVCFNYQTY